MTHYHRDLKYNVLRLPDVKEKTGLSRSAIYQRIADGHFPKQINLGGGRAVGWLASDIEAWVKQCLAQTRTGAVS
jgi:prophage regulatory protein